MWFVLFAVLTGCASKASTEAPSILLVSLDTFRADRIGAYGDPDGLTPNLDAFAAESTLFENAYSQATQTAPSHASMFTSRYPSEESNATRRPVLGAENPLLAQVLKNYDYQTAAFTGGADLAPEMGMNVGFDEYEAPTAFGCLYHTAPLALRWLDARDPKKPFFVFVHGYDTHSRYLRPAPWGYAHADMSVESEGQTAVRTAVERIVDGRVYSDAAKLMATYDTVLRPRSEEGRARVVELAAGETEVRITDEDTALIRGVYDGAVSYADTMFGLFLAALQDRGLLDTTIIVLMADHGEQLGEHGVFGHCCGVDDEESHVPLMIRMPGGRGGGKRVKGLVELVDLMPTLLELAHATPPAGIQGHSLVPALMGQDFAGRAFAHTEGSVRMRIVSTRSPTGRATWTGLPATESIVPELVGTARLDGPGFDWRPETPANEREALRSDLVAWMRTLRPVAGDAAEDISPELKQTLRANGYWDVK